MTQPPQEFDLKNVNFPLRLQPEARKLMEGPLGVLARQVVREVIAARKEGLPVAMLEVCAGSEPLQENWQEVVIRIGVLLGPEEAAAAWEDLERRVAVMRESLDMVQREILDEAVALEVVWRDNGAEDGGRGPA